MGNLPCRPRLSPICPYTEAMAKLLKILIFLLLLAVLAVVLLNRYYPGLQVSSYPVLFNTITGSGSPTATASLSQRLSIPAGFELSLFADDIPNPRLLKITSTGQLLVSSPRTGTVFLLMDENGDGRAEIRRPLLSGLNRPHGIDILHDGHTSWLYVAETDAVGRVEMDWASGQMLGEYQRLIRELPTGGNHWSRTLRFGPDGLLYVTVGSSCNACVEKDPLRAAMIRYRPDGSGAEIFASGLRNSVGFDWAPWDNRLYATDNGRDLLGDNFPPCELNLIQRGGFYGWPYINGFGALDPDYGPGQEQRLTTSISPAFGFRAHNAPLGIHFLRHQPHPDYRRTALVALHGSWNRSEPDGYKVVALHWDRQGNISSRDFVSGFLLPGGQVIGRPVDIAEGADGSIYLSDDYAGVIYRVLYK